MTTASMAVTQAAVRMAMLSRTRRWCRKAGPAAETPAATMSGTATARASSWSTSGPVSL